MERRERIRGALFNPDGTRRLPGRGEMARLLDDDLLPSELIRFDSQLFFIPTAQWIAGLARLIRLVGAQKVLEAGAGDGFTSQCLRHAGVEVTATDLGEGYRVHPGPEVVLASHTEALERFEPDFVLWCWPPFGARFPEDIITHPKVRYYLDVGDGGFVTGSSRYFEAYNHRYLKYLSTLAYTWVDGGPFRHNRNSLFFGRAHPRFKEFAVKPHPTAKGLFRRVMA